MITIDSEKCVRCGQCAFVCPMALIGQEHQDSVPKPIERAEEFCIACGHCVAACDVGAVNVGPVLGEKNETFSPDHLPTFDQVAVLLKTRRSVRHFRKTAVPESMICELLDVVRWAPSARNLLPVKWLVVNSPDLVHELAGLVVESSGTGPSPCQNLGFRSRHDPPGSPVSDDCLHRSGCSVGGY